MKQIAADVRRTAVLHDPRIAANDSFLRAAEDAASAELAVTAAPVNDVVDIERVTEFAREQGGGLIVAPAPPTFN